MKTVLGLNYRLLEHINSIQTAKVVLNGIKEKKYHVLPASDLPELLYPAIVFFVLH